MKKIISLLMIMSIMMLSIGTAFAWDYEVAPVGLNVLAEEDENGLITVTVSANDTANAIQGFTVYLALSGVKAVKASDTSVDATSYTDATEVSSALKSLAAPWTIQNGSYTAGSKYKVVIGSQVSKTFDNEEVFKAYFVKTDANAKLSETAFDLATSNSGNSKISYADTSITKQSKTEAHRSYFGIKVVPYTAPGGSEGGEEGGDDPVVEGDWTEATVDNNEWNADNFAYVDAAGNATTGVYAGKKVVAFGKNATGATLAANEYGVIIGANKYPGIREVPAGHTFAIVLIDTNNDAKVKGTYTYSIWATNDLGEDVIKASGLNAQ